MNLGLLSFLILYIHHEFCLCFLSWETASHTPKTSIHYLEPQVLTPGGHFWGFLRYLLSLWTDNSMWYRFSFDCLDGLSDLLTISRCWIASLENLALWLFLINNDSPKESRGMGDSKTGIPNSQLYWTSASLNFQCLVVTRIKDHRAVSQLSLPVRSSLDKAPCSHKFQGIAKSL